SSRRRHTRWPRDWSSDVCSSDLAYRVGGVADHVHLAIRLSRTITIADLVETLKTSSSKWVKTQSPELAEFSWQRGYGCFPVGPADLDSLRAYIDGQEEHHKTRTF